MDKTVQEQRAWEHYKGIEDENFHLKKRIAKLEKENKSLKHHNRALKKYKSIVLEERERKNGTRTKRSRSL